MSDPQALRGAGDAGETLIVDTADAHAMYVLAHGAGAGMRHPFMHHMAEALARHGVSTLRYQFPYMEGGRGRPDSPAVAQARVKAAVEEAARLRPSVPLIAGGKSYGGRMTSQAAAAGALPGVRGLAFLGFPLHAPGKPSAARADHLRDVGVPMLFLQGTRDDLADLELLRPICERLGARARLHVIEGANHSFSTPKRSGRTAGEVIDELASVISAWSARLPS